MTAPTNGPVLPSKSSEEESLLNSVKIISDLTRRDIEKLYNVNFSHGSESYYSNRYGRTLRKNTG